MREYQIGYFLRYLLSNLDLTVRFGIPNGSVRTKHGKIPCALLRLHRYLHRHSFGACLAIDAVSMD